MPRFRFILDVFHGIDSYPISGGISVSQGQMAQWDTGARIATTAVMTSGSIFLGIVEETSPMASLGTAAQPLTGNVVRIRSQGIHEMKTTNGEVYSHLQAVYAHASDQEAVTNLGSSRFVGRVHSPTTTITGTGNNSVPVRIIGSMTNGSCVPSSSDAAR